MGSEAPLIREIVMRWKPLFCGSSWRRAILSVAPHLLGRPLGSPVWGAQSQEPSFGEGRQAPVYPSLHRGRGGSDHHPHRWRDATTQGHTRTSETPRPAYTPPSARQCTTGGMGGRPRAQQRVWPGLHSAWQGRPGEVGGGKEVFPGIRERPAPPAPQEQQCLGPAQAAVRRSNGGLEAAHQGWTPTHTPRGLEP